MSAPTSSSGLPGYSVAAEGYDEALDEHGRPRATWRSMSTAFAGLGPAEVVNRQRHADRLVESEGASHLFHDGGDDASRPWRLDPLPLVISGREWADLERGVAQRVRVLDRAIADIYGDQELLRRRIVPPAVAFGAPGYLLAARGQHPSRERWLTTYAADLVRLADGRWCVLRDLADAPVGAGYALVNRTVTSQLMPEVVREAAPLPLGPFFADMRAALDSIAPDDRSSPRTVVLSPGVGHPSYFEHSYLASHLGYHLAEPGDLVVRHSRVWLRALSGLEQIDVLLRRVEAWSADPLESPTGAAGVPGLARAARTNGVGLANALGTGVVGSLAMLPHVGRVADSMGDSLHLGEVRTLWCGHAADRREVLEDVSRFVLHDVTGVGLPGSHQSATVFGSDLDERAAREWRDLITSEPHRVAAQQKMEFATAPVTTTRGLRPATVVLRVLAVNGRNGVSVLPGGLARVMDPDVPVVRQTSGSTKDVWVLDDRPDRPLPIVTRPARTLPQVDLRESLPTRVAEAMYWLGRNAERAEQITRATSAAMAMVQADPVLMTLGDGSWRRPVIALLHALGGVVADDEHTVEAAGSVGPAPEEQFRRAVALALTGGEGLPASLRGLSRAATSARQFVSATTWRVLGELGDDRTQLSIDVPSAYDPGVRATLDSVIVHLSSLSGLFNESTVRGPAWRFLELGRRVERAVCVLTTFETAVSPTLAAARGVVFDTVLAANESLVAYRRRYRSDAVLDALIDLLVLDDQNPRAVAFQLDRIRTQVARLPAREGGAALAAHVEQASAALMSVSWLSAEADQLDSDGRRAVIDRFVHEARVPLYEFADQLNHVYFNDPTRLRQRVGHL